MFGTFGVFLFVVSTAQLAIEFGHVGRLPTWLRMSPARVARGPRPGAASYSLVFAALGLVGLHAVPLQQRFVMDLATTIVLVAQVSAVLVWVAQLVRDG